MHRLAEAIQASGRDATLIQDSADFHPGWFQSSVQTISFTDWSSLHKDLDPRSNILIVPETFLGVLHKYAGELPVVVFNQNGSYSFGLPSAKSFFKPESVIRIYQSSQIIHVLCVSLYDLDLLASQFLLGHENVSCIRNGIESICAPLSKKRKQICYMSRKNALDVTAVVGLLKIQPWIREWEIVEISGLSHAKVVEVMQNSLLYLSFGHPEGFGLPIAEAMSCACAVVGYSGLGGRELFALANLHGISNEVPVGDWPAFLRSIESINYQLSTDSDQFISRLLRLSQHVRRYYSYEKMLSSVRVALQRIENSLPA